MSCENNLCIYCYCQRCILGDIQINEMGMCHNCLQIRVDDKLLFAQKKKMLRKLHADNVDAMIQNSLTKDF